MKSLLRPFLGAALLAAALLVNPPGAPAQTGITHVIRELNPLLSHSQGYLGVLVTDVDNDSVQKLRLKDSHGAIVTLIDHDAPAGPVLHVNDVILEVNGQKIQGAEEFGRILKEVRAGQSVSLVLFRDGAQQTVSVQLVDRKAMEQAVWRKMNSDSVIPPPTAGMGMMSGGGDTPPSWHLPFFTSSLNVGALVEPLTSQMADYLGIASGIMIKEVSRKSAAAAAGLKPFDIILKVSSDPIATTADWDRALRTNQGRAVPVTVLRERKQQIVTLQVDSKHHSKLTRPDMFPGRVPRAILA
ncbi:MAG TPA: PDZ domain-containing protein [Terracidiphilus sp.]|nr:PDZ domain-containing protein [Terracidiphilus sp.]